MLFNLLLIDRFIIFFDMIRDDNKYNNLLFAIIYQSILDVKIESKRTEYVIAKQDANIFLFDYKSDNHKYFKHLCFMLDLNYINVIKKIQTMCYKKDKNINQYSFKQLFDYLIY